MSPPWSRHTHDGEVHIHLHIEGPVRLMVSEPITVELTDVQPVSGPVKIVLTPGIPQTNT